MELKEYFTPLLRWWWLIVVATVVAAGSSFLAARQQPDIYRARSTLMIGRAIDNPNPSGAEFWLTQQLAQTYAEIAVRDPVRHAAMERLGLDWLPEYSVQAIQNTQLVEISVTDTSPERAQAVSNELSRQLILQSPTDPEQDEQSRQLFVSSQLDNLEGNINATEEEILAKQSDLAAVFGARQISDLQTEIRALQTKLTSLQSNYANLLANTRRGAINTLAIIEPATLPSTPIGPGASTTIIVAAAIGFSLAAAAAYLLEFLDDSIETPDQISKAVNLPTLAGIARIHEDDDGTKLVALSQPRSPMSEAYRVLRTGIQFAAVDAPEQTRIMVTSAYPAEGKSLTVANLAVVMAQAGHNVLVIDADLRRPSQHELFQLSQNRGLTSLLLEFNVTGSEEEAMSSLERVVQHSAVEGLHLLASGPIPPNPSELLGSAKMARSFVTLATHYDYIIVDSPPVLAVTDAVILSTRTDGVLLVVDAGRTRQGQLKQAVEHLLAGNANLLGVVLNRLTSRGDGYHTYYYYRHSYYSGDDDEPDGDGTPSNGKGLSPWRRLRRSKVVQE